VNLGLGAAARVNQHTLVGDNVGRDWRCLACHRERG
jgi:hypothetical protein